MSTTPSQLPPGAYVLDCRPYGPPKLLSVDPATLSKDQRMSICTGISTYSLHEELSLVVLPNDELNIIPLDSEKGASAAQLYLAGGAPGPTVHFPLDRRVPALHPAISIVASLAASYAGGQQLNALFNSQKQNIDQLIAQAVQRMDALVGAKLDEQVIRRCQARIDACRLLLAEFENAPQYEDRLTYAVNESTEAVREIGELGWSQFEAFGDAAGFRLLALCVRTKHSLNRGELENMRNYVSISLERLTRMVSEAQAYLQGLVDGIGPIGYADIERGCSAYRSLSAPWPLVNVGGGGASPEEVRPLVGGPGDSPCATKWWKCKAFFYDNGQEYNVIDVYGDSEWGAKNAAYNKLNPTRESQINARAQQRDRVVSELNGSLALRQNEWQKSISIAQGFPFKDRGA